MKKRKGIILVSGIILSMLYVCLLVGCCANHDLSTQNTMEELNTEAEQRLEMTDTTNVSTDAISETRESFTYEVDEKSILANVPIYTYSSLSKNNDMGDGSEMLIFKNVETDEGYVSYRNDLRSAGFQCYAENEIEENMFSTWVNETITVTLMYIPMYERLHIVAEPKSQLSGLVEDNIYMDHGIENVIAQVGGDYNGETKNGMCYIYRLCDGSFLVVDAPHESSECAEALYETLRLLSPDQENIVIAAWFITHAHNDHVGGVITFAQNYSEKVSLERLIYNFPHEKDFRRADAYYSYAEETKRLEEYYADVDVIEAHPGQIFNLRDAEIEMLYTWELMDSKVEYFNNTSLVFSVQLGGEKIMHLGDCGPIASQMNVFMYDKYLKSDIVQVSHHGFHGAITKHNELIDADIVLWPSNEAGYTDYWDAEYNHPFHDAQNVYVAEGNVTVLPLPYDPSGVEIWDAYGN